MLVGVTSGYFYARLTSARLPIQPEFSFSIEVRILNFLQDHGAVLVTAGTDLRYELTIRGLESSLRKRAVQKGRSLPW